MNTKIHTLPDDIDQLKEIISSLNQEYASLNGEYQTLNGEYQTLNGEYQTLNGSYSILDKKYTELDVEYTSLKEKFEHVQKMLFGKKSEKRKLTPEDELQGRLFNEAELAAFEGNTNDEPDNHNSEKTETVENQEITVVKEHTRKKAGRKPINPDIPRVDVLHDVSEQERHCTHCKNIRPRIGSSSYEELVYKPAELYVKKHIYPAYGPCECGQAQLEEKPEVITAPACKRMLPGSIASEELYAFITVSKFCDALPYYRLSGILERIDVYIPRATMCNWQNAGYDRLLPLFAVMKKVMMQSPVIRMDETPIQVLHEEDRRPETKSYMWVAIGYPRERTRPLVLYEYHPSRGKEIPLEFLDGFSGFLQTDGYKSYNEAAKKYHLSHVGCFAHARRDFVRVKDNKKKDTRSWKILQMIGILYKIEDDLRKLNCADDVFLEKRKKAAEPVLEKLHAYLLECREVVVPSSVLGEAVSYTLNEWSKLVRYLDHAWLTPDNNEIERTIKLFVIGRKNWLFANTPGGAHSSAGMYSLIQSAKINRLDPYKYLLFLFKSFPHIDPADETALQKLLPCNLSPEDLIIND